MVFLCIVFGAVANKISVKWVLVIGTLGYAPYSASLYVNNRYGVEWFVIFGGATCGIAAAALWTSEAAIALGYGRIEERGKFSMSLPVDYPGCPSTIHPPPPQYNCETCVRVHRYWIG